MASVAIKLAAAAPAAIAAAAPAAVATAAAPVDVSEYTDLLLWGGGFAVLIPLIVVTFVVSSQGVFKKAR